MGVAADQVQTSAGSRGCQALLRDVRVATVAVAQGNLVKDGVSLQQLVDGLNGLGIGPRDLIGILQAIKAAGAIQADIEVM